MTVRTFALLFVAALTTIFNGATFAGGPPPVSRPQACVATYCVEVVPQDPYLPYGIETVTDLDGRTSRLVVKLRHGGAVAFQSRLVERLQIGAHSPSPTWKYDGDLGVASACLTCIEPSRNKDQVLGIAIAGVPLVRSRRLAEAMEVCYWPLNMGSAGNGTGHSMTLGNKVCVIDAGRENYRK